MWPAFTAITLTIEVVFYYWLVKTSVPTPEAQREQTAEIIELFPAQNETLEGLEQEEQIRKAA